MLCVGPVSRSASDHTASEPGRAWRSHSVRPAVSVERRVSRDSLRLTAPGSRHTFQSPTDSRYGNCRVCRFGRLSAFAAAGRSEPHSLQPTPPGPAPSTSRGVSDSSAHRRETQCGGLRRWPQAGSGDRWRGAHRFCRRSDSHQGVAALSRRSPFRRWLQPDAGFTHGLQPSLSEGAVGRRGALIFERFRARLPAQSPAMAASRASRSTQ